MFGDVDRAYAREIDDLVRDNQDAGQAVAELRQVCQDTSPQSFINSVLRSVRSTDAFHYDPGKFRGTLDRYPRETKAELVIGEHSGMSRYVVADDFAVLIFLATVGGTQEQYAEAMKKAVQLAGHLGTAVDHLLVELFERHEDAIVERVPGTIETKIWGIDRNS